ncbi:hypothetical protein [Candidatus Nanobsidianus stetteri]|uniref:Uncharacterized protein n=1 Tax=Nanobsidianus stetteri TaxID=1294122 RepID=A0AAE3EE13_NANST|nr:hypothetical protein [Candidatus Nanobsidianus stetteri]MCC5446888.1 hypothetical protein [Candidatus Nanobsidianus stetteri]
MKKIYLNLVSPKNSTYYHKANKIINHLISVLVTYKCKNESTRILLEV